MRQHTYIFYLANRFDALTYWQTTPLEYDDICMFFVQVFHNIVSDFSPCVHIDNKKK